MKRFAAIVILLLVAASALAQTSVPGLVSSVIHNFEGLFSGPGTALPPSAAMDVYNFDFQKNAVGGIGLIKRTGFQTIGDGQAGYTGGLYRYRLPGSSSLQLMGSFGRDLYFYSPTKDAWSPVNENVLTGECACTNGKDTVRVLGGSWWPFSTEEYDSIFIGTDTVKYGIRKLMTDTLLLLRAVYAGATATLPCYLKGRSAPVGSSVAFTTATGVKPGIVFKDTLNIFTIDERVEYAGVSAAAVSTPSVITAIGPWDRTTAKLTLTGNFIHEGLPRWYQLQNRGSADLNIAVYVFDGNASYGYCRVDTNVVTWLTTGLGPWSAKLIPLLPTAVVWDTILKSTIDAVTKDSVLAGYRELSSVVQGMRTGYLSTYCQTANRSYFKRRLIKKQPMYIFRHRVTATTPDAPEVWPKDSISWMTTVAKNIQQAGLNNGLYYQGSDGGAFPVTRDTTAAGAGRLWVTTFGVGGNAVSVDDSTVWEISTYAGNPCIAYPVYPAPIGGMPSTFTVSGGYMRFSPCVALWNHTNPACTVMTCSLAIACYPTATAPGTIIEDGGRNAFEVGDSLVLFKMRRTAVTPLASQVSVDTTWDWPIVVQLFDRFWMTGDPAFPNTIFATTDNAPDVLSTTQVVVFDDDGANLSALSINQNIIYAHKPTGIYAMPVDRTGLEPLQVTPTLSPFGALSMAGLAQTQYGHFFVSWGGIYKFDGVSSELFSAQIATFWQDSLNPDLLPLAALTYDPARDRLMCAVARTGATQSDITLVYDFQSQTWTKYNVGAGCWHVIAYPGARPEMYWTSPAAEQGRVMRLGGSVFDSGQTISAYWQTGWLPLAGEFGQRSSLFEWFLEGNRRQVAKVGMTVFIDGSGTASFTDTTAAGSGLWDSDRRNFTHGLAGERFSFRLTDILGDSTRITGLRIDHAPEGVIGW